MEIPTPPEWEGREVDTIDALLHIKQQVDIGRPLWLFCGTSTLQALAAWMDGYAAARSYNRRPDRFARFIEWLRDVKGDMPGNWIDVYLQGFAGDQHQAVHRFLGHVVEFAAQSPTA